MTQKKTQEKKNKIKKEKWQAKKEENENVTM